MLAMFISFLAVYAKRAVSTIELFRWERRWPKTWRVHRHYINNMIPYTKNIFCAFDPKTIWRIGVIQNAQQGVNIRTLLSPSSSSSSSRAMSLRFGCTQMSAPSEPDPQKNSIGSFIRRSCDKLMLFRNLECTNTHYPTEISSVRSGRT